MQLLIDSGALDGSWLEVLVGQAAIMHVTNVPCHRT